MVYAENTGEIRENPSLHMVCARGGSWHVPEPEELLPLPAESELFLLPGRRAVGFNSATGRMEERDELAVAAFAAPGYTLTAHPAYIEDKDAPMLPLFAYGAVGFAKGRFWICASEVDKDPRQRFRGISRQRIWRESRRLLDAYSGNRLVSHIINNCVRRYDCPAARNFALGRYEAPIPTSRTCNARCLGCISLQDKSSPLTTTPQCRLAFLPEPEEIAEVMSIHERREKKTPIYSFGQGCEGDPLMNTGLLCESVERFRSLRSKGRGHGTVNCNTNGSRPAAVARIAKAGFTSIRVSMNSARPDLYSLYYRPVDYVFDDVRESMRIARGAGLFVSINLLYFPGVTDTREEIAALGALIAGCGVSMIQLRNLNIDPRWYMSEMGLPAGKNAAQTVGLRRFMRELLEKCPWLRFGYFNPWLGDRAELQAPLPI